MTTKNAVIEKLKEVKDPELSIDIVRLGLVRNVILGPVIEGLEKHEWIEVLMTLTSPFCPYADTLITDVEKAVESFHDGEPRVELVFEPPWEPSQELKDELGI